MTWDLLRSSGLVLLVLFSLVTALGMVTATTRAGGRVPALVPRTLHRDLALLTMSLLVVHVVTAVLDSYVDIRWWQVVVPFFGATFDPLWLGLGTLALDLLIAVAATTALRGRLGHRAWRGVHLLAYASWPIAVAHGIGIGTDIKAGSQVALWVTAASVGLVIAAGVFRLAHAVKPRATFGNAPTADAEAPTATAVEGPGQPVGMAGAGR